MQDNPGAAIFTSAWQPQRGLLLSCFCGLFNKLFLAIYMGYYHLSPLRRVLVAIDTYHEKSKMAGNNSVAIVNMVTLKGPLSYTSQKP